MHRLTLITLGEFGTPVGIYLSAKSVDDMLEVLDNDADDNVDKIAHIEFVPMEDISYSIRSGIKKTPYQSMVEGISKAMELSVELLRTDPTTKQASELDRIIKDCVFLFMGAYTKDNLFSEYHKFIWENRS